VSSPDRRDEPNAAQIVRDRTGGSTTPRDVPGAPSRTHDFDLRLPDGKLIALEITSNTDPVYRSLFEEIRKQGMWPCPALPCSLYLLIDRDTHIRTLRERAEELLVSEPAMQTAAEWFHPEEWSLLYKLGVRAVRKLPELIPSQIVCEPDDFDLRTLDHQDGHALAADVEQLARQDADKLGTAVADERHLFVWIDFFQKDAMADLRSGGLPLIRPALPPEVDVLWVAEAFCPGRVLTYSRSDGWTDSGIWQSSEDSAI
jgi:hypothetical protein